MEKTKITIQKPKIRRNDLVQKSHVHNEESNKTKRRKEKQLLKNESKNLHNFKISH